MKILMSVVMTAYNCEDFVGEAIQSILSQSFKEFEFIILDDASTDATFSIIKKYASLDKRIVVLRNKKNMQIARSLNKGIHIAKSNIIVRMDSDDISYPKRLEKQYNFFTKHPRVAVLGSNMDIMNKLGRVISRREYLTNSNELKKISFRYSPFAHPSVVFKKNVFEEFGGYNSAMVPCEDIDLWFKIGSKYEFANIPQALLKYRLIISSNSHKNLKKLELIGFKIKINAIRKYGYKISFEDALFNMMQFVSLWFMPAEIRIYLYNFLRSKKII
ncbi:N/A [soil metagenome]